MKEAVWREEANGNFVAESVRLRLMVHRTANCDSVRFLVLSRRASGPAALIGSGTTVDIAQGMNAAQKMATRFLEIAARARPLAIVVDDNGSMRQAVADALRDGGYKVVEAATGEGALRRLERTTQPAVMVTDIDLGTGMNGLELAGTVRKLWPTTGILLVSGDERSAGYDLRTEFLAKPFSSDRLLERVAAIAARMQSSTKVLQH